MRGRLVAVAVLGGLLAGVGGLTAARAGEALPGAAVERTDVGGWTALRSGKPSSAWPSSARRADSP